MGQAKTLCSCSHVTTRWSVEDDCTRAEQDGSSPLPAAAACCDGGRDAGRVRLDPIGTALSPQSAQEKSKAWLHCVRVWCACARAATASKPSGPASLI